MERIGWQIHIVQWDVCDNLQGIYTSPECLKGEIAQRCDAYWWKVECLSRCFDFIYDLFTLFVLDLGHLLGQFNNYTVVFRDKIVNWSDQNLTLIIRICELSYELSWRFLIISSRQKLLTFLLFYLGLAPEELICIDKCDPQFIKLIACRWNSIWVLKFDRNYYLLQVLRHPNAPTERLVRLLLWNKHGRTLIYNLDLNASRCDY